MAWVRDLTAEELEDIVMLKKTKFLRPYAKFLIVLYKYGSREHYTNIVKEVVGGNYITLAKEGVAEGLVEYERGKPPRLTAEGRRVAEGLAACWEILKAKEKINTQR